MAHDLSKGMHWIGHPGSLQWIIDRGNEGGDYDINVSASTSIGGGSRLHTSRTRPHRTWSLAIPHTHADEISHVETLLVSTLGPYQLVTAKTQVSNVLTPDRSVWRSLMPGSVSVSMAGSWPLEGGKRSTITALNPSAMFGNQALVRVGPFPVPPAWTGRPVTISCHLGTARAAGTYVVLDWLDAAGAQIGSGAYGGTVTGMDILRRSTVTATPPAGAVAGRIGIPFAEVLANPQVTWTDAPIQEWSVGKGADRVTITGFGEDNDSLAVPAKYDLRRSSYSLSLRESGPAL